MPRYVSLDVGDRRIGVAVSDPTALVASPLRTLDRRSQTRDAREVAALAEGLDAAAIVVGLPLSLDGSIGPQAKAVQAFCEALARATKVPVHMRDERFTTAEAERRIREAGGKPSRERARVDAMAAAIILQEYLDSLRAAAS